MHQGNGFSGLARQADKMHNSRCEIPIMVGMDIQHNGIEDNGPNP